jgi:hypothetical protein
MEPTQSQFETNLERRYSDLNYGGRLNMPTASSSEMRMMAGNGKRTSQDAHVRVIKPEEQGMLKMKNQDFNSLSTSLTNMAKSGKNAKIQEGINAKRDTEKPAPIKINSGK